MALLCAGRLGSPFTRRQGRTIAHENDPIEGRQGALAAAPPPVDIDSAIAKGGGDPGETVRVELPRAVPWLGRLSEQ